MKLFPRTVSLSILVASLFLSLALILVRSMDSSWGKIGLGSYVSVGVLALLLLGLGHFVATNLFRTRLENGGTKVKLDLIVTGVAIILPFLVAFLMKCLHLSGS